MKQVTAFLLAMALVASISIQGASASTANVQSPEVNTVSVSNVTVSEVMTYDEMLAALAQNSGISYQTAENDLPKASDPKFTYRILSVTLNVTSEYKPTLDFYCETSESRYWGILSIFSVQLNREYNGMSKQFIGSIEYFLRSPYQIQYIINGDFCNNATVTVTGDADVSVGIGGSNSISFGGSVGSTSNHYKYFNDSALVSFQG